MIYSRKYSRNFIPLKQDNTSYNLDFKPAIGRCLIEIKDGKGKVSVYAQGIKPNNEYNVELMCFQKGALKNANIGILSVDEMGKGEIKADFDPENVLNTGNKIEDFNIVALIVNGLDKVVSSLVGYVGNEVNWKNKYIIPKHNGCCPNDNNMPDCNMPEMPAPSQPGCNMPEMPEIPSMPEIPEMPSKPQPAYSELEQGLIEKEEGLIEREKGLFDREQGLIQKEQNLNSPVDLADFEKALWEKEQGLLQKEQGLFEKEKGLFAKEKALNQGYLPSDADMALRGRELELIEWEKQLINHEETLIKKEQNILDRQNPTSCDLERGLREKQQGLLERERGLLERERGLIAKEEGLFEKEQGIRDRNKGIKERENALNPPKNNNSTFKDMLDKLKGEVYNSENSVSETNISKNNVSENLDIDYIKFKNMPLSP
ncbi:MAG: hypothetical protein K2L15_02410, partial [Eubacteriales bacterium]|nr:hypothetical protein [Eubacteriales bacterium]